MLNKGTVLTGRYEIIERIGTGGMADVYKALDNKLNRYVAIKVLKREFREDEQFVAKFRQEARAVAGLSHPNIVSVYDVGSDDAVQYIVLELVEGITLKKYIEKKGHLPFKEAVSIAIQVANGMEAAHAHHIVHRDIKPQNIIISKEGKVKVTDFGIAKATQSSTTTVSTAQMGSVHYMSPEQARGGYSDERSDIYSFGITLFEMLTGDVPFDGDSTVAVAVHHIQDEIIPPSQKMSGIPVSLDKIVQKCTKKKVDARYQNADELIADLKRALINPDTDFVTPLPGATQAGAEEVQAQTTSKEQSGNEGDATTDISDHTGFVEETEKKKNPRFDRMLKWIGIGIAAALALVIIFFSIRFFTTSPENTGETTMEQVGVPNVIGKTKDEAEAALRDAGLIIDLTEWNKDGSDIDEVGDQEPKSNEMVDKGSKVKVKRVVPTTAPEKSKKLPDLAGKTEDEAIKMLNGLKEDGYELDYNISYEYNGDVPFGNVISTSPKAGENVKNGRTINILVSRGGERVEVPNLANMTLSQVEGALDSAGLKYTYSGSEWGVVDTQKPVAGTSVEIGSTVEIVMKERPTTTTTTTAEPTTTSDSNSVSVPIVVRIPLDSAIEKLESAGLSYTVREVSDAQGTVGNVVYQSPNAGTIVEKGGTVNLTVKVEPQETTAQEVQSDSGDSNE